MDKRLEELKGMEFMELRNQPDVHMLPTLDAKSKGSNSNVRALYYVPKGAEFIDTVHSVIGFKNKDGGFDLQALYFIGYY